MVRYSEFNEVNFNTNDFNPDDIKDLAEKYFDIFGISIDENGFVNAKRGVAGKLNMRKLPVKFLNVEGNFSIIERGLQSLEGCPKHVGQDFDCSFNKELSSLIGGPESARTYQCSECNLESLKGSPKYISENFYCHSNKLSSLHDAPRHVENYFNCIGNPLETFEGFNTEIGIDGYFFFTLTPNLPLLRLLRLKCKINPCDDYEDIIPEIKDMFEKYRGDPSRKNILACQRYLIDAGFEGNAKW